MSNMPETIDSRQMAPLFRRLRETVLRMLEVVEGADSTPEEKQRACNTIRDAIELQVDPNRYGMSVAECELNAAARHATVDRLVADLDSQEAVFAEKLRQLMKAKLMTQAELASRVGCTQPAISQMLKRECRPQKRTILALASALGVDPRDLWPELEVAEMLDTIAAVQDDQDLSEAEAAAIGQALKRPVAEAPAAPLPKRKR
ncbi:MAG: helix-turn-helix domain-containing protein [Planctomycetales bacterium]